MKLADLHIVPFQPNLADYFKELNLAWVRKYFFVEPLDEEMLSHPQENIINKGGQIFFAQLNKEVVGTFALLKVQEGVFELSKMAVVEKMQGKKIGNQLLEFAIDQAKQLGAQKLILFSNTKLSPAIHLYKKYCFTEVPIGASEYKRSDIKMEKFIS